MSKPDRSMFSDRRGASNRRKQNLPIPSALDRRANTRRSRGFISEPWWLRVDYADELVVEVKTELSHYWTAKPATETKE